MDLYSETIFLESFFNKKKDPNKNYITRKDIDTIVKDAMDLFSEINKEYKKQTGKQLSITIFKDDFKVNKQIKEIPIGMISTSDKKIVREIAKTCKMKNTNKLVNGYRLENLNNTLALIIKIKSDKDYYFWKE